MSDLFVQYEYAKSNGQVTNNIAFAPNYKGSDWADSGLGTCIYLKFSVDSAPSTATNIWWGSFVLPIDAANDDFVKYVAGVRVKNNNGRAKATLRISKGANTGATVDINFDYGKIVEIALYPSGGRYYVRVNGGQVSYDAFSGFGANDRVLPLYSLLGVSEEWDYSTHAPVLGDGTVSNATYNLYNIKLFNQDTMSIEVADDADVFLDVVPGRMYQTNTTAFKDLVSGNVFETTEFEAFSPVSSGANYPQAQVNNIYIGSTTNPTFLFTNDQLTNVIANLSIDVIGNELTIDTLSFDVFYDDSDETLRALTYATPIWLYHGSNLVGKFYFKTIERIGTIKYKISAVSIIGLLEYEKHYGGYYASKNAKEAIMEMFISNGLQKYERREYISHLASAGEIRGFALRNNFVGDSVASSGMTTSIYVKFSPPYVSDGNTRYAWRSAIYKNSKYYDIGVEWYKSSGFPYIRIYASYGTTRTAVASFTSAWDDIIEVAIHPGSGKAFYRISNSRIGVGEVHEVTFTALTDQNLIMPIYSFVGTYDYVSSLYGMSTHAVRRIYRQCFFRPQVGETPSINVTDTSTVYLDIAPVVNYFTGENCIRDLVTGKVYTDTVGYYECGGAYIDTPDAPADMIPSYVLNGEMANIANNIQWGDGVENLSFSGWIPIGTKRETLHQILFALNLNLYKTSTGDLVIGTLPDTIDAVISEDETYDSGSVEPVKKPKKIELAEYSYNAQNATEEVFDNTGSAVAEPTYVAEFSSPICDTPTGTGLQVMSYNANAAVVSGIGSISARTYKQSKRVISETVDTRPDGDTVSVSDATLVTFLNSNSVMKKLKAYYANSVYKIKNSVLANVKVGRKYTVTDAFGEVDDAHLASANINISGVTKYDCEFIAGFELTPSAPSDFSHYVLLTGSGVWAVPEGVEQLRVVLIGGGSGGSSGLAGEDGGNNYYWRSSSVASGGEPGVNGSGGKIYIVEIENALSAYQYSCGSGGDGGAICTSTQNRNAGSAGGDTTFGGYSSANGTPDENGYLNLLSGDMYASPMPSGVAGGDGGYVEIVTPSAGQYPRPNALTIHQATDVYNPVNGVTYENGGFISPGYAMYNDRVGRVYGSSGGAANGQDGSLGSDWATNEGGDGGNATYVPPVPTDYNGFNFGSGGMGGSGGGGGGSAGFNHTQEDEDEEWLEEYVPPGKGGYGGVGGKGGDGCIVVYY